MVVRVKRYKINALFYSDLRQRLIATSNEMEWCKPRELLTVVCRYSLGEMVLLAILGGMGIMILMAIRRLI